MRSLYVAGRAPESLAAYQRYATFLGEELGLRPSLELQELESQILLQLPLDAPTNVAPRQKERPERLMNDTRRLFLAQWLDCWQEDDDPERDLEWIAMLRY